MHFRRQRKKNYLNDLITFTPKELGDFCYTFYISTKEYSNSLIEYIKEKKCDK